MSLFTEKFLPLIENSGKTDAELEKEMGLPRSIIYDWKTGRNKSSYKKYASNFATYFNVSTDYLLGREENTDSEMPSIYFSIAQNARDAKLTEHDVNVINNMIKAMMDEYNKDKK